MKRSVVARRIFWAALACGLAVCCLPAFQQLPFREYPGFEHEGFSLPPDWSEPGEFVFGRLMYPSYSYGGRWRNRGDWRQGYSTWTIDYPASDRNFARVLRRLTRLQVRSVEQPINLDDGTDPFYWPWLYGVEVGSWDLTDVQTKKLREYLLRGGFLMVDDFHGTREWAVFMESMSRVFPDRQVVDLEDSDAIFHMLYDLDGRYQVPGAQFLRSRRTYEQDGIEAKWRGIYDDHGRVMVAICHNMDLGDAVEWADSPRYPEKYSALAIRIFANYVIYAMSH
jgi:hypothetical protein